VESLNLKITPARSEASQEAARADAVDSERTAGVTWFEIRIDFTSSTTDRRAFDLVLESLALARDDIDRRVDLVSSFDGFEVALFAEAFDGSDASLIAVLNDVQMLLDRARSGEAEPVTHDVLSVRQVDGSPLVTV
jgi:hypothetical protein